MPSRPNPRAPAFPFPKAPSTATATTGDFRSTWSNAYAHHPTSFTPPNSGSSHTPTPVTTGNNSPKKLGDSVGSLASSASSFDMADIASTMSKEALTGGANNPSSKAKEGPAPLDKRWVSATPFEFVPRAFTTPLNKGASEGDEETPRTTVPSTVKRIDIPRAASRFSAQIAQQSEVQPSSGSEGSAGLASSLYPPAHPRLNSGLGLGSDAFPQYANAPTYGSQPFRGNEQDRPHSPPFPILGKSFENALRSDDSSDSSNNDFFQQYATGYTHPLAFARVPPPAAPTGTLLHRQSAPDMGSSRHAESTPRLYNPMTGQYDAYTGQFDEAIGEEVGSLGFGGMAAGRGLADPHGKRNVFIHSIPAGMNSQQLRNFAERYGDVAHVKIGGEDERMGVEPVDGKRYAYVLMATPDQAMQFIMGLREQGLASELAKEDWQTEYKAREDRNSSNVYVVGLPIEWSKDDVEDFMTQFGRVASLRLLEDKEGNRRGPILIRRVQADRAIQALNNNIHPVSGERMQARVADSDHQKDYKRLRSTADSLPDDRRPSMSTSEDLNMVTGIDQLLAIREKYERKLQMINMQLTSLTHPHTRLSTAAHRYGSRSRSDLNISLGDFQHRPRHMSHDFITPPPTSYDGVMSPISNSTQAILTPPLNGQFHYGTPGSQVDPSPARSRTMSAHTGHAFTGSQQPTPERRFVTVGSNLGRSLAASTSSVQQQQAQQRKDVQALENGGLAGLWHARSSSDLGSAHAHAHEAVEAQQGAKLLWPGDRA